MFKDVFQKRRKERLNVLRIFLICIIHFSSSDEGCDNSQNTMLRTHGNIAHICSDHSTGPLSIHLFLNSNLFSIWKITCLSLYAVRDSQFAFRYYMPLVNNSEEY